MGVEGPNDEAASPSGFLALFEKVVEFWDSTERALSVLAGLFLAVVFCLMPFSALGAEEPWYFWVGSGLVALAASVLLAWVFFPPTKERKETSGRGTRDEGGA